MTNLISVVILALLAVVQSTLVHFIAFAGVKPDLPLIALVCFANKYGRPIGQTGGFISGIIEDFMSLSPLGFHGLINTLVGFVYGFSFGKIFVDPFLIPMILTGTATILKLLLFSFVAALFSLSVAELPLLSLQGLTEIIYNAVLSLFLFKLLSLVQRVSPKHWRDYSL
jgi:rod shape-determining protein MreD